MDHSIFDDFMLLDTMMEDREETKTNAPFPKLLISPRRCGIMPHYSSSAHAALKKLNLAFLATKRHLYITKFASNISLVAFCK